MKSVANFTAESIALFWESADKPETGCWQWKLYINRGGYGHLNRQGVTYRAHRVAYELAKGPIPEDLNIDHRCHNRACINPDHLRAATQKQNLENYGNAWGNTGIRGVHYIKAKNRYLASVRHHGKQYYCGIHKTAEEAEATVVAKRNELFTHNDADRRAIQNESTKGEA